MFGVIKRNPKAEHNPLLCNLKDRKATRMTEEAVTEILYGMLIKIPEYQTECETIRGIGSHRITRFDLVETEVIQERIKAILNGSNQDDEKKRWLTTNYQFTMKEQRSILNRTGC